MECIFGLLMIGGFLTVLLLNLDKIKSMSFFGFDVQF